jgi:multidrug efflux pump
MGYSINILTMLALVLAIGMVVDDAIVVLENIYRHIEHGMRPMQAAFKAMDEISFAIIAITVSLVAVFCRWPFRPARRVGCLSSSRWRWPGRWWFRRLWRLSLSDDGRAHSQTDRSDEETQLRGARFRAVADQGESCLPRALVWSLLPSLGGVARGLGTLGLMVVFYRALDKDFLPEEDKGRLIAFVVAPEGATIEYTDRMMREMEGILRDTPEVLSLAACWRRAFRDRVRRIRGFCSCG